MGNILIKILSIEEIDIKNNEYILINDEFSLQEGKVVYNEDGSFNRVKIDDNTFVNISSKNLNKKLTKILKNRIHNQNTIIENSMKVNIGHDFSGEYVYSKYSRSITNFDKFVKAYAALYLKELIENSSNREYSNDHKQKHIKDAKYGFYKYKVNFSVIINNKEYFYKCKILIRINYNGERFLYDILDFKKID